MFCFGCDSCCDITFVPTNKQTAENSDNELSLVHSLSPSLFSPSLGCLFVRTGGLILSSSSSKTKRRAIK